LVFVGLPIWLASPADPNLWTIEDYLRYALTHNPGLQAALHRSQAAQQQVAQVRSLPDARVSYRYFFREVETRVGAQQQAIEISQTFPWPGKLDLAGRAAAESAEAARQQYEAFRLELVAQVKDAFFEYSYLARSIEVTKAHLALLAGIEAVARTRYQTGSRTQAHLGAGQAPGPAQYPI
jgi:outer membrane protein TolC